MSKSARWISLAIEKDASLKKIHEVEELRWDIAELVFKLRKQTGLNQTEFAKRVGKSRSTIARIETGAMEPSLTTLADITTALDKQLILMIEDRVKQ